MGIQVWKPCATIEAKRPPANAGQGSLMRHALYPLTIMMSSRSV